ncbi:MAG: beta-lactamase family protein [bacterium]|nr:beta-lactamase family protein [bacterium]
METVRPESVGLSSEQLAHVDRHLKENYVDPGKIPGCQVLVFRRGGLAHHSVLGKADLERGTAAAEDTIYRIYSMTKPITSVALMQLHEEARFSLSDPVHRYIPEFRDLRVYEQGVYPHYVTVPCERPMTIRDLLTHQSGLTYGFMARTNVDAGYRKAGIGDKKRSATLEEMTTDLAALPLEFSPGTAWNYSVSTDVCGRLVEVLSGQSLDAYFRERILDPLGMADTGFSVPDADLPRFAANYERRRNKTLRLVDDPLDSEYKEGVTLLSGGGGLVSTAADYLRFCRMLLGGGTLDGTRILGRKTLDLMTRNHLPEGRDLTETSIGSFAETPYEGTGFGLGFSVILDTVRGQNVGTPGEFAWGGAASTVFWVDPVEDLTVVFLTQLMPSRTFDFRGQLKSIVYGALLND